MNAEFNVWLLIVGLVVGAGLAWVVMMNARRDEADVDAEELPREAAWLSAVLGEEGYEVSPEAAEQVLLLHRAYLDAPPPDPVPEAADGTRAGATTFDDLTMAPPATNDAQEVAQTVTDRDAAGSSTRTG